MAEQQFPREIAPVEPSAAQFDVRQVAPLVEPDELVRQPGVERPADPAMLDGWADLARVRKDAPLDDLKGELTFAEP